MATIDRPAEGHRTHYAHDAQRDGAHAYAGHRLTAPVCGATARGNLLHTSSRTESVTCRRCRKLLDAWHTFTIVAAWDELGEEELDVLAPDEDTARALAQLQLELDYEPGHTITRIIRRMPGELYA